MIHVASKFSIFSFSWKLVSYLMSQFDSLLEIINGNVVLVSQLLFPFIFTMAGNWFDISIFCRKPLRQLRTKTNTFVAYLWQRLIFCVGMLAVPKRFFCNLATECTPSHKARLLGIYLRVSVKRKDNFYLINQEILSCISEIWFLSSKGHNGSQSVSSCHVLHLDEFS